MENKNKIEESLIRFKELISESNLYGNLVNEELLNEGGGVLSIVDDIIKKIKNNKHTNGEVVKANVFDVIDANAKGLFKKKFALPTMKSKSGFEDYITNDSTVDGALSLSGDLKKALRKNITDKKNNKNIINTKDVFKVKDANGKPTDVNVYDEIVDEYIKVFDEYSDDLAKGAYSVESLQSKPELNKILSLVDETQKLIGLLIIFPRILIPTCKSFSLSLIKNS